MRYFPQPHRIHQWLLELGLDQQPIILAQLMPFLRNQTLSTLTPSTKALVEKNYSLKQVNTILAATFQRVLKQ
jgi:hypothetical protein